MNMKYKNKYSTWFGATAMLLMISSCDGFLDKMPDNRTELDNNEKVLQLLVSAYSTGTYVQITELMSDNVADNGPLYISYNKSVEESYKWQDFTDNQQDTPQFIWNEYYKAIALPIMHWNTSIPPKEIMKQNWPPKERLLSVVLTHTSFWLTSFVKHIIHKQAVQTWEYLT